MLRCLAGWSGRRSFSELWKSISWETGCRKGFVDDVDGFIAFLAIGTKSSQEPIRIRSGKSSRSDFYRQPNPVRAGSRNGRKAEAGFFVSGGKEYSDHSFDTALLTMLGAKTSCKDRWRQVLAEAKRIDAKHLLTLEAAISVHQTDQMQEHKLQLVVPRGMHSTFTLTQQRALLDVAGFTALVRERETRGHF